MKIYLVALSAGLLVGAIYSLIGARSPAPPLVALLGLFGMLLGEQGFAVAKRLVNGRPLTNEWLIEECLPKITGAPVSPSPAHSTPLTPTMPDTPK